MIFRTSSHFQAIHITKLLVAHNLTGTDWRYRAIATHRAQPLAHGKRTRLMEYLCV